MNMKALFKLKTLAVVPVLVLSSIAHADYSISLEEIKLMPSFCRGLSLKNFEPDARRYATGSLPKGMPHSQHFCHGLKFVVRANKKLGDKKNLRNAAGEFEYVLSRKNVFNKNGGYNGYVALVSTESARVFKRLGNTAEAISTFQQAIKYNPKLPQAYAGLSDLYRDLGMDKESREILEKGLSRVPKSKSLQRRLSKLPPKSK